MSAHTEGPWVAEDLGANCLTIKATGGVSVAPEASALVRDYYQRIASATQRDPHPRLGGGIPREVAEANARLIAAAPDHALVARAICTLGARWEAWSSTKGEFCIGGLRYATDLDEFGVPVINGAIRAAIAKATGEQA